MTGIREHFSDLRDPDVRIDISLVDDRIVTVAGVGTVPFRREDLPPISFTDVLFVPGMKKNLISVSTLQDRGFEVLFIGSEVLIYPRGASMDLAQRIGVRGGNCTDYFSGHYLRWGPVTTAAGIYVSCGIVGWPTFIMELLED